MQQSGAKSVENHLFLAWFQYQRHELCIFTRPKTFPAMALYQLRTLLFHRQFTSNVFYFSAWFWGCFRHPMLQRVPDSFRGSLPTHPHNHTSPHPPQTEALISDLRDGGSGNLLCAVRVYARCSKVALQCAFLV